MLDQRIDLSYDFQASFDVYLGNNANGADGLAFVLQNDPLGAHALGALAAATVRSGSRTASALPSTLGKTPISATWPPITLTSSIPACPRQSAASPTRFRSVTAMSKMANWHNVLVSWSATDHTLTYWFDGQLVGLAQPGHRRQLFGRLAICLSRIYRWNRRPPQSAGGASQFPDRLVRGPVA